ncbi:hypothetical protein PI125_g20944 [Phytophthora idaei]|nr:hypothetical protein PI125_g20944 [Phytophthora idaei]
MRSSNSSSEACGSSEAADGAGEEATAGAAAGGRESSGRDCDPHKQSSRIVNETRNFH